MSHRLPVDSPGWSWPQRKAALLMYPSYMVAIAGRVAMDAALPAMLLDQHLLCGPADTARLLSTGVMFYSLGKVVGGGVIDRVGGALTFTVTMVTAGIMQGLCSVSGSVSHMSLLWGIWRLAAAGFWPAMNKVVASWWDEDSFGQAWSILSTSSKVGAISGGVMAASILRVASWRVLLRVASALLAASGGMMMLFLRDGPGTGGDDTKRATPRSADGFVLPMPPVGEPSALAPGSKAVAAGRAELSYPGVPTPRNAVAAVSVCLCLLLLSPYSHYVKRRRRHLCIWPLTYGHSIKRVIRRRRYCCVY